MTELEELQRALWLLAFLVNGGKVDEDTVLPEIKLKPAIGEYGAWQCSVEFDFTAEGEGRGASSQHHGSIVGCLNWARAEIRHRMGRHWKI
jgi:hypothetical protein